MDAGRLAGISSPTVENVYTTERSHPSGPDHHDTSRPTPPKGYDQFVMAMIDQDKGLRDEARTLFNRAAQRESKNHARGRPRMPDDLRQLWSEAARRLGRPGPPSDR